jgi:hypothetical protein
LVRVCLLVLVRRGSLTFTCHLYEKRQLRGRGPVPWCKEATTCEQNGFASRKINP